MQKKITNITGHFHTFFKKIKNFLGHWKSKKQEQEPQSEQERQAVIKKASEITMHLYKQWEIDYTAEQELIHEADVNFTYGKNSRMLDNCLVSRGFPSVELTEAWAISPEEQELHPEIVGVKIDKDRSYKFYP